MALPPPEAPRTRWSRGLKHTRQIHNHKRRGLAAGSVEEALDPESGGFHGLFTLSVFALPSAGTSQGVDRWSPCALHLIHDSSHFKGHQLLHNLKPKRHSPHTQNTLYWDCNIYNKSLIATHRKDSSVTEFTLTNISHFCSETQNMGKGADSTLTGHQTSWALWGLPSREDPPRCPQKPHEVLPVSAEQDKLSVALLPGLFWVQRI